MNQPGHDDPAARALAEAEERRASGNTATSAMLKNDIDSGRTGYIVAQNNVSALAERLQALAADPAALAQMSDEVRADMAQYAPERILDRWEDLFREMAR